MAAVAGLRGTGDWGTDERPKNFRESILFYEPNGDAPLTALMAKAGKKTTNDPEFAWWSEPVTITRLKISGTYAAGDTLFTVDSTDPTSSTPDANYGGADHLAPGDLLMVEPATETAANILTHEYVEVVSVISATQFTVSRGAAGSTAASIADDVMLLRIGSVFAEGTTAPAASSRNPIKYSNYTQIFKTTYDVTRTAANTFARTGDVLANDRKRKMTDHSKQLELSFMFGRSSETTGANGKPKRTTNGLRRQIASTNITIFTGAVSFTGSSNNFLDAVYKVFDWKTGAGDTRIGFVGNAALNALNKMAATEDNVRFNMNATVKQYGMELRELILPQGRILLRSHPLLNQHAVYSKSMWLVDFSAIKWCPLKGSDTKHFDNVQAKDDDSIRGYWLTEAGLMVDFGGLSCGYLGNIVAA